MSKRKLSASFRSHKFNTTRHYPGLQGKVVDWVEHKFVEVQLYLNVRFTDRTELCWRIGTRMTIEEEDLSDWKTGDFENLRVFVRKERDRSV